MFQLQWLRMVHQTPWRSIWGWGNSIWGKAESKGRFPKLVCNKPGLCAKGCESTILRLLKEIIIGNVQFGCGVTGVS